MGDEFLQACADGRLDEIRDHLKRDANLVHARTPQGATGLHLAARHPDAVRLLLEHGADPNARDAGENATPLHLAAANGALESVRALLDAGADPQGAGDLHAGGVIGWAIRPGNEAVLALLLERGARHHIFSAMALRDRDLVRRVVVEDPGAFLRRRSRFESGHTPIHAAFAPPDGVGWLCSGPDYGMLELLLSLGADVNAADGKGRTPLEVALLRADREAVRILRAAGAREPSLPAVDTAAFSMHVATASASISKSVPMFSVADMRATVQWYEALGFTVADHYEDDGGLIFARLTLGSGELALSPGGSGIPRGVSHWFFTDRVQELYDLVRARALDAALADAGPGVAFEEDLYSPFYGGRQFSVRDPNGLVLVFYQPEDGAD